MASFAAPPDSVGRAWFPSPTGAALRSLALPGWGQFYNRSALKGVIVSGAEEWLLYGIHREHQLFKRQSELGVTELAEQHRNQRNRLTWYFTATLILAVMDAYVDAHLYGFDISEELSRKPAPGGINLAGVRIKLGVIGR